MSIRALKKKLEYKIPQIRLAVIKEREVKPVIIRRPLDIEPFAEPLRHLPEEHFVTFHLNASSAVIGYHIVSQGTLSASLVHPREVFKAAFLSNCQTILLAHNHPGGTLKPSPEDLETTERLLKAGQLLQVAVIDHLIVASGGICSIRELHPRLWMEH